MIFQVTEPMFRALKNRPEFRRAMVEGLSWITLDALGIQEGLIEMRVAWEIIWADLNQPDLMILITATRTDDRAKALPDWKEKLKEAQTNLEALDFFRGYRIEIHGMLPEAVWIGHNPE